MESVAELGAENEGIQMRLARYSYRQGAAAKDTEKSYFGTCSTFSESCQENLETNSNPCILSLNISFCFEANRLFEDAHEGEEAHNAPRGNSKKSRKYLDVTSCSYVKPVSAAPGKSTNSNTTRLCKVRKREEVTKFRPWSF